MIKHSTGWQFQQWTMTDGCNLLQAAWGRAWLGQWYRLLTIDLEKNGLVLDAGKLYKLQFSLCDNYINTCVAIVIN